MNRALPQKFVDLVRDGVPAGDRFRNGDAEVWRVLVACACSASQRGWTRPEWIAEVSRPQNVLSQQARMKRGKEVTERAHHRTLVAAWDAADRWLADKPPSYTLAERLAKAAAVRDLAADADASLDDAERAVLAHAAEIAAQYGTDRPALPRRQIQEATGLNLTALRLTLARLESKGLLVLAVRGRSAGPRSTQRRANLYRLPLAEHAYLYRETRLVVPSRPVSGAPSIPNLGAPGPVSGAPLESGDDVVELTFTIRGRDPVAIAKTLQALQSQHGVEVEQSPTGDLSYTSDNVTPIEWGRRAS